MTDILDRILQVKRAKFARAGKRVAGRTASARRSTRRHVDFVGDRARHAEGKPAIIAESEESEPLEGRNTRELRSRRYREIV